MLKMLIALTCLTLSMGASAAQIVYTLNDVVFDDGTTASGTFTYDTDPGPGIDSPGDIRNFVNINITTINGKFLGDSYTGYSRGDDTAGLSGDFAFVGDAQGNVLIFDITGVISDLASGGTFALLPDSQEYDRSQDKNGRYVQSGSISAVPIPAAVWLFGSALLGLGAIKRREEHT